MKNNNQNINVGFADVFEVATVKSNIIIKALGDPTNPLIEIWAKADSKIHQAIKVGDSIGYLKESKNIPDAMDPRKMVDRDFYSFLPSKAVERFMGGVSNV